MSPVATFYTFIITALAQAAVCAGFFSFIPFIFKSLFQIFIYHLICLCICEKFHENPDLSEIKKKEITNSIPRKFVHIFCVCSIAVHFFLGRMKEKSTPR